MLQKKIIHTKQNEIWIDDEGILVLRMSEGAEMDLEEVTACFDVYRKLGYGNGQKIIQHVQLVDMDLSPKDLLSK